MILPGLPVWICSSAISWTLASVGSLLIYILLTPAVLRVVAFGIPDSYFFLHVVLLGLNPWHFATLGRFCNPSSGGWKLSSHLGTHNGCDKVHIACLLPMGRSTLVSLFPDYLLSETPCFVAFLVPSVISRGYLISPCVAVSVAVPSPLPACSVDFR
jgi:hypothetical protein